MTSSALTYSFAKKFSNSVRLKLQVNFSGPWKNSNIMRLTNSITIALTQFYF